MTVTDVCANSVQLMMHLCDDTTFHNLQDPIFLKNIFWHGAWLEKCSGDAIILSKKEGDSFRIPTSSVTATGPYVQKKIRLMTVREENSIRITMTKS